jgi:hypothetical protein
VRDRVEVKTALEEFAGKKDAMYGLCVGDTSGTTMAHLPPGCTEVAVRRVLPSAHEGAALVPVLLARRRVSPVWTTPFLSSHTTMMV